MVTKIQQHSTSRRDVTNQQGNQQPQAPRSSCKMPTAAEQEQQLQADRAMLDVYRRQWQSKKGVRHAAWRHVCDVLWWLEHVCGVNMLDYEEKVVVVCIFLAVLVLIFLGAYKQSTVLLHLFKQLLFAGPTH